MEGQVRRPRMLKFMLIAGVAAARDQAALQGSSLQTSLDDVARVSS